MPPSANDTRDNEIESQLRQSQKLESIGTLASGVAHEINNPINGIMNYAQLVMDNTPIDSSVHAWAREIVAESDRVAGIVRNLLQFARHDRREHSPARMCDIVNGAILLVNSVLRKDQVLLLLDIPEDLPPINCRTQQIQQVLLNLLTNARDALNERYPGHDPEKMITVRAVQRTHDGQNWIRLTVEDTGTGIPEAIRERIFDPFFTTKPPETGTGLGLSISHGIIREHGGTIAVDSRMGRGTVVTVDIPCAAP
jgi:signal transduction histidine kinase